jgi:DNA polymerase-3 subunit epsilon
MSEGVQRYLQVNRFPLSLRANWERFRFVSVDSESTGLNPQKDRIISLAGVALESGDICLWDQFSVMMPVSHNTASVTIHGITRQESVDGIEESAALDAFLRWLGDGVIAGHHIQHDLMMLNRALVGHYAVELKNVVIDTMEIYLKLREFGAFESLCDPRGFALDGLLEVFGITPHDRHTASGDAYLTALLLQRLLKEAGRRGLWNLEDLGAWYANEKPAHREPNYP